MLCLWIRGPHVERCRALGFEVKRDQNGRWSIISYDDPVDPDAKVRSVPPEAIEEVVFGWKIANIALRVGRHWIPDAFVRVDPATDDKPGKGVIVWARSMQAAAEVFLRAHCNRWPEETYRFEPDTS